MTGVTEWQSSPRLFEIIELCRRPSGIEPIPQSAPIVEQNTRCIVTVASAESLKNNRDKVYSWARPWTATRDSQSDDLGTICVKSKTRKIYYSLDGNDKPHLLKGPGTSSSATLVVTINSHPTRKLTRKVFEVNGCPCVAILLEFNSSSWREDIDSYLKFLPRVQNALHSATNAVRMMVSGSALNSTTVQKRLETSCGESLSRTQIQSSLRQTKRILSKSGRRKKTQWNKLYDMMRTQRSVRSITDNGIVIHTRAMIERFRREVLMKKEILEKKRRRVISSIEDFESNPTNRKLQDVLRILGDSRNQAPVLQTDTTFALGRYYLSQLVFKSRNFARSTNKSNVFLCVSLFLHTDKMGASYKHWFDEIHNDLLCANRNTEGLRVANVCSDYCPSLAFAIRMSSLFRDTQHVGCAVHAKKIFREGLHRRGADESEIRESSSRVFLTGVNIEGPKSERTGQLALTEMSGVTRERAIEMMKPCAKDWATENHHILDSLSLQARGTGLCGIALPNSNGVEACHKKIVRFVEGETSLDGIAETLQDGLELEDLQLHRAANGGRGDFAVMNHVKNPNHELLGCPAPVPTFFSGQKLIECYIGVDKLAELVKKSADDKCSIFDEQAGMACVFDTKRESLTNIVKSACKDCGTRHICTHIICFWMQVADAAHHVDLFMQRCDLDKLDQQKTEAGGHGTKSGRARRLGNDRTRRDCVRTINRIDDTHMILDMDSPLAEEEEIVSPFHLFRQTNRSHPSEPVDDPERIVFGFETLSPELTGSLGETPAQPPVLKRKRKRRLPSTGETPKRMSTRARKANVNSIDD